MKANERSQEVKRIVVYWSVLNPNSIRNEIAWSVLICDRITMCLAYPILLVRLDARNDAATKERTRYHGSNNGNYNHDIHNHVRMFKFCVVFSATCISIRLIPSRPCRPFNITEQLFIILFYVCMYKRHF